MAWGFDCLKLRIIHNVYDSVVCISFSQHESLTSCDTTARLLSRHVRVLECGVACGVACGAAGDER
jgi:hypothetical protein